MSDITLKDKIVKNGIRIDSTINRTTKMNAPFRADCEPKEITLRIDYQQWPEKIRFTDSEGNTFTSSLDALRDFLSMTAKTITEQPK